MAWDVQVQVCHVCFAQSSSMPVLGKPFRTLLLQFWVKWMHPWFIHHQNVIEECIPLSLLKVETGGGEKQTQCMWNPICTDIPHYQVFVKDAKHTWWWHSYFCSTRYIRVSCCNITVGDRRGICCIFLRGINGFHPPSNIFDKTWVSRPFFNK